MCEVVVSLYPFLNSIFTEIICDEDVYDFLAALKLIPD